MTIKKEWNNIYDCWRFSPKKCWFLTAEICWFYYTVYTKITDKMDEATKRSLMRENEAAETIAKNGYNIEQNPVIEGTTRNPDYIIEGEIFDCYSPAKNTKIRNVASTIEEKVIKKGQTERVVLDLDDWKGDVNALVKQLNDYPIEGLKEVIVVHNGSVQSIYP